MKLEFSGQIFLKIRKCKIHENTSSGSRGVPCGRTDGHEVDSRFSHFCERACTYNGVPLHVMKAKGGVEAYEYLHSFLTSALVGGEC
jgi:hypothetical protein